MDFRPTPRAAAAVELLAPFVRDELLPLEPALARDGFVALLPVLEGVREKARQTGLFAAHLPESLGGAGLTLTEFAAVSEVLGRSPLGHYAFNCQAPDVGNMEILHEHGTPDQKARFLAPLAAGAVRSSFTMTEPEHPGSNPTWLGTTARLEDDHWVIRGHKWFTTGFEGCAFTICMAVTEPEADPHTRASMIIVPADTPGLTHVSNLSVMGHRGGGWASHGEVMFHDARVPEGNLLGVRGMGFVIAQHRLGPGRIHHCMRWIGICERALDILCRHAATREIAPGRPLGTRQIVQQWIAESRAEIHGARLMVLHAAWRIEHEGPYAAREEISLIKFTVARTLQRVLDRAIQRLGVNCAFVVSTGSTSQIATRRGV
ncbi:acyl-CoA dehydrogenase family protein, partial [Myxococcota bacterium]|nr:acyl-CoA dehydrogenase family protein [Myxococcota bacterium]